jgi:hypothetical protein
MESKFWSTLPVSKDPENPEGIIDYKKVLQFVYKNIKIDDETVIQIDVDKELGKEELYFVLENGLSSSGNSYILDPKLCKNNITIKIKHQFTNIMLGFMISFPHSIHVEYDEFRNETIQTVMSTHLCVSLKHRQKEIAKYLIAAAIDTSFSRNILTGYHYILTPKSESNILVYNYYRPLLIENAIQYGYEVSYIKDRFKLPASLTNEVSSKELTKLQDEYNVSKYSDFTIIPTIYSDLDFLQTCKRKLSVKLTEEEFTLLQECIEWYTIKLKNKVVGIFAYKTMIMHVSKIQKGCPIGRVVLLEMKEKFSEAVISKCITHLQSKRYSVMAGICFGELSNEKLRKKFGFVLCGTQYLDFYNLQIKLKKDASDSNLLYI